MKNPYLLFNAAGQAEVIEIESRGGEVSGRLGFRNPFHFSRVFRRHEGFSPKQFKQLGDKCMPG